MKPVIRTEYQLAEYEIIQCHACGNLVRGDSNEDSVVYTAVLPCFTGGESLNVWCKSCHQKDEPPLERIIGDQPETDENVCSDCRSDSEGNTIILCKKHALTENLIAALSSLVEMWNDENCDNKVLRALFRDAESVLQKVGE